MKKNLGTRGHTGPHFSGSLNCIARVQGSYIIMNFLNDSWHPDTKWYFHGIWTEEIREKTKSYVILYGQQMLNSSTYPLLWHLDAKAFDSALKSKPWSCFLWLCKCISNDTAVCKRHFYTPVVMFWVRRLGTITINDNNNK